LAEFEANLRFERQMEGIAKAKAARIYKGRKPSIDPEDVARLKAEGPRGWGQRPLRSGWGESSVYRIADEAK
jgi:DNA invertase Pin-like site-specific DNA recombinase